MKKILFLVIAAVLMLPATVLRADRDRIIDPEQLPAPAKVFIKQYFPETPITFAQKEMDDMRVKYSVHLEDGTEIEFNSKGEWDNVDCQYQSVPEGLVPPQIAAFLAKRFPGQSVVKIDKERFGYELELSNDLELKFDKKGRLLEIDD